MNTVQLIGRLTHDPELKYIPESEKSVTTFTLAVDRQSKSKGTDFIRITVFGKQAENCSKYISKGRQVAVEGRIQTGSYQNKNSDTVYTTDVIANRVQFLGDKSERELSESNKQSKDTPEGFSELDDDEIPF